MALEGLPGERHWVVAEQLLTAMIGTNTGRNHLQMHLDQQVLEAVGGPWRVLIWAQMAEVLAAQLWVQMLAVVAVAS